MFRNFFTVRALTYKECVTCIRGSSNWQTGSWCGDNFFFQSVMVAGPGLTLRFVSQCSLRFFFLRNVRRSLLRSIIQNKPSGFLPDFVASTPVNKSRTTFGFLKRLQILFGFWVFAVFISVWMTFHEEDWPSRSAALFSLNRFTVQVSGLGRNRRFCGGSWKCKSGLVLRRF